MSRVDLSSVRVEVVLDEERVPGVDEIDREVIGGVSGPRNQGIDSRGISLGLITPLKS